MVVNFYFNDLMIGINPAELLAINLAAKPDLLFLNELFYHIPHIT